MFDIFHSSVVIQEITVRQDCPPLHTCVSVTVRELGCVNERGGECLSVITADDLL